METDNINQQVPPAQNAEQPQSPPPNPYSHSKIFIIVLGIMFVLMIGIGSYVLGTRKNQTAIQNPQPISSPTQPSPTTAPDETANWKTYTNSKYKYTINYPPSHPTDDDSVNKTASYVILYESKDTGGILMEISAKTDFDTVVNNKLESTSKMQFVDYAVEQAKQFCAASGPNDNIYCDRPIKIKEFDNSYSVKGYEIYLNLINEKSDASGKLVKGQESTIGPIFAFDISQQTNNQSRGLFLKGILLPSTPVEDEKIIRQVIDTLRF